MERFKQDFSAHGERVEAQCVSIILQVALEDAGPAKPELEQVASLLGKVENGESVSKDAWEKVLKPIRTGIEATRNDKLAWRNAVAPTADEDDIGDPIAAAHFALGCAELVALAIGFGNARIPNSEFSRLDQAARYAARAAGENEGVDTGHQVERLALENLFKAQAEILRALAKGNA